MDTDSIQKPIRHFLSQLKKEHIRVDRTIVFGSYSRNEAHSDSDIDVVIVSKDFRGVGEQKRLSTVYKASAYLEPDIHPWPVTAEELEQASKYSLIGQARDTGILYPLT